jgi:hypothetical protein
MSNRTRKGGAKKVDVFGMVGTENDGAINVIINAALIARRVTERYKDQYPEAQEMALEQSFDRVWRHERQHVIQEMDPEKKKDMKMKTALATIPVSLGTYGATYAASYALTHGLSHTGTSGDYAIIVTSAISGYMAAKLYGMHYGPIEREAHEMAKPENYKRNSPFKVNFEK